MTSGDDADHPDAAEPGSETELRPLSPVRRVVARRLTEAWRTIPAVTLHRSVSFAPLLAARERLTAPDGRRPAVDALLAIVVGRALAEHDLLNGSFVEEQRAVLIHPHRHVAVAVDTQRGLTAVVVRDADRRAPADLDRDLVAMVERARSGRSLPADLADATFTITNLGALGVDMFDPIITPPQSAVLGIGAIQSPTPTGGRATILSLTFDHRVLDGADGARFLGTLTELIIASEFG
jgi:pyruvate dehydrogenase E2 component (dihydrolipoamide acetyltransferase)